MQAKDIMTTSVISVPQDGRVEDAIRLMLDHHVSALPVVDVDGAVKGLVSEGDLMRRVRDTDGPRRSWWLELLGGSGDSAHDFVKLNSHHVTDVMTRDVVSVEEDTAVAEIAREIDDSFANGDGLSFAALREIPLLERFVFEVLRLHPPLVTLMRLVKRDFKTRGLTIPAGETIVISPYVAHRIPELYPDPERFDPSRPVQEHLFAYIPFGGGNRRCIGSAFAEFELRIALAILLTEVDLDLLDDHIVKPERHLPTFYPNAA